MGKTFRLAVLAFGFAAAATARAEQGSAVIQSKSTAERTVVLDGTAFRVSEATALEDADGNAIDFQALPSMAEGANADAAAVWFEADEGAATPLVLHRLKLTGAVPK